MRTSTNRHEREQGIPAKKSLGQNFLRSGAVADEFVRAAAVSPEDVVVEVGPGKGFLTEHLLQRARTVIAIEKDDRMVGLLKETFAREIKNGKLALVHGDILSFKPGDWQLGNTRWKLVGSIPYYITGRLLRTFLGAEPEPASITLIMQKEVAERIARSAKESILSLSVKAYGAPHYVATVERRHFSPQPNVDSAILHIDDISKKFFSGFSEAEFFRIVKEGFKSKRKKLCGNLRGAVPRELFAKLGISPDARAENLPIETWRLIARAARTASSV